MKKTVLITVLMLLVSFCFSETEIKLDEYFCNKEYSTEKFKLDFSEIYYSYQNAENSNWLVNKAIFYVKENNCIKPLLIINNEKIYNSSELLFNGIIDTQKFYGYEIDFSCISGDVSTAFYTNNGKNVTEGPLFVLDKKTMKYSRFKINPLDY